MERVLPRRVRPADRSIRSCVWYHRKSLVVGFTVLLALMVVVRSYQLRRADLKQQQIEGGSTVEFEDEEDAYDALDERLHRLSAEEVRREQTAECSFPAVNTNAVSHFFESAKLTPCLPGIELIECTAREKSLYLSIADDVTNICDSSGVEIHLRNERRSLTEAEKRADDEGYDVWREEHDHSPIALLNDTSRTAIISRRQDYVFASCRKHDSQDTVRSLIVCLSSTSGSFPNALAASHTGFNINIVMIDSLSLPHFKRSLPATTRLMEALDPELSNSKLLKDESTGEHTRNQRLRAQVSAFAFDRFHGCGTDTPEVLSALFNGRKAKFDDRMRKIKFRLLGELHIQNYKTMYQESCCWLNSGSIAEMTGLYTEDDITEAVHEQEVRNYLSQMVDSTGATFAACPLFYDFGIRSSYHHEDIVCYGNCTADTERGICSGVPSHKPFLLSSLEFLTDLTPNNTSTPRFSFLNLQESHEGSMMRVRSLDEDMSEYFARLYSTAAGQRTITIFMSDHGNSYGDYVMDTIEGKSEVLMPFLYILLPESFVSRFPRAQTILSINTKALTSAHDLYHTMRHIDQLSRSPADRKGLPEYSAVVPNKYPTISSESSELYGQSLFEIVSSRRNCKMAGIPRDLCHCQGQWSVVRDATDELLHAAEKAVEAINLSDGMKGCDWLYLHTIHGQMTKIIQKSSANSDRLVQRLGLDISVTSPAAHANSDDPAFSLPLPRYQVFMLLEYAHFRVNYTVTSIHRFDRYAPYDVCRPAGASNFCVCDVNDGNDIQQHGANQDHQADDDDGNVFMQTESHESGRGPHSPLLNVRTYRDGLVLYVYRHDHALRFEVRNLHLNSQRMYKVIGLGVTFRQTLMPGERKPLGMVMQAASWLDWSCEYSLSYRYFPVEALKDQSS